MTDSVVQCNAQRLRDVDAPNSQPTCIYIVQLRDEFLLTFMGERGCSTSNSYIKDMLVIKLVLKSKPYINATPLTCLLVATKDLHFFREEEKRVAGRCAAAAPISGQTLAVCFLEENITCYTSAHTGQIAGRTLTAFKMTHQIEFVVLLMFKVVILCYFWRLL